MKLTLMLTARCNASCSHCGTNCGPQRTEALSRTDIFRLMDEAAALTEGEPLRFGLTGGEPFLDFALLRDVVAHGRSLGADVACVSNGYWATTDERARALLTELKDAGLASLSLSTSRFHQQFIKLKRVERAFRAARAVGLPCVLKHVRLRSDADDAQSVRDWARAAGATAVQDFSVLPHLREGETLPEAEYTRRPGLPEGACPFPLMTVDWNGQAYTCCNPGSFNPFLSLGNVRQAPLHDLRERFYLGGKQQLLREHGPIFFARALQAQGLGARLRDSYTSVCDLCTHIATDPVLAEGAEAAARDFEMQQLDRVLERLVEPAANPSTP